MDDVVTLALDTISKGKQALIFVNTKRSAEKVAEDIAKHIKIPSQHYDDLAYAAEDTLAQKTEQCERLARCLRKGIAFHHAGLHSKQRTMIEDAFRERKIPIICSTPTLAAGLDLPASRAIIRDLKRYGTHGLTYIPVLEYLQMSGRSGRPKYDSLGESIVICKNEYEKEEITNKYLLGEPESIQSKLAVEPVLRTYVLSLIATKFCRTREELFSFFSKSFWAHQYHDQEQLTKIIVKMLDMLEQWEFIVCGKVAPDFVNADELTDQTYRATPIGQRVAELYLDPYTAHDFVKAMQKASSAQLGEMSFLQLVSHTLEMRPLLRAKTKEYATIDEALALYASTFLTKEPSLYDPEYEDFLHSVKTGLFFRDWMQELTEQQLLDIYDVRPGESRAKLEIADWLLYCCDELVKIQGFTTLRTEIQKIRLRLKHGAKEELLPLLRLRGIGRVRARKLFNHRIKDLGDIKNADETTLTQLLGEKIAQSIKDQVGMPGLQPIASTKRKGQMGLGKYEE